jgi:molybdopterin molybdotransferase
MVSIEEAQQTILALITTLETEKVSVFQGLNRVTPEDHIAPWDIPAADNSAMDGFAFSSAVLAGNCLQVTGFLPAGEVRTVPVLPGEAVRIMTGAPVPSGCDTVVPIEDVEDEGEWILLPSTVKAGSHVRRRGEDIRCGNVVNSNSYSLAAQVLDAGGDPVLLGIAPDTLDATCEKIRSGLNADMLVITGVLLDRGFEMGEATTW